MRTLTVQQKNKLEKHKVHHSKKHVQEMKRGMRKGKTFSKAHALAQKSVGK